MLTQNEALHAPLAHPSLSLLLSSKKTREKSLFEKIPEGVTNSVVRVVLFSTLQLSVALRI
jgi:hypothetical protein